MGAEGVRMSAERYYTGPVALICSAWGGAARTMALKATRGSSTVVVAELPLVAPAEFLWELISVRNSDKFEWAGFAIRSCIDESLILKAGSMGDGISLVPSTALDENAIFVIQSGGTDDWFAPTIYHTMNDTQCVIDAKGDGPWRPGTQLVSWKWNGGPNQRWKFSPRGEDRAWKWSAQGMPGFPFAFGAGALANDGNQYVFMVDEDNKLWLNECVNGTWSWANHENATGAKMTSAAGTLTVSGRVYAFVTTDAGTMHCRAWFDNAWEWTDHGAPPDRKIVRGAGAVTVSSTHAHAWAITDDAHLWLLEWDGNAWVWSDRGGSIAFGVGAIAVSDRPYEFVVNSSGELQCSWYSDQRAWEWDNYGASPGGPAKLGCGVANVAGLPHAFVLAANGHLCSIGWTGSAWTWNDLGAPPGAAIAGSVGVTSSAESTYVFVTDSEGQLWVCTWDGATWQWASRGLADGVKLSAGAGAYMIGESPSAFAIGGDPLFALSWVGIDATAKVASMPDAAPEQAHQAIR